jgi:hypothetical protein
MSIGFFKRRKKLWFYEFSIGMEPRKVSKWSQMQYKP